uniref:AB hydrolase-1 domain-containing protein n=1 Tax=Candidozyma auris TaxID=498019 RepID=A0A0L0P4G9_CANAR
MLLMNTLPHIEGKEYFIGGIKVNAFNTECLAPYIEKCNKTIGNDHIKINVLYLLHQRGGDTSYTNAIAQHVIDKFTKASDLPLVAVTFDLRNHGSRVVDDDRNGDWASGNKTHAIDMVSAIHGNVADLKLIIDFLPACFDLDPLNKDPDMPIRFNNIVSGYSLGAHVAIRFANTYPDLVSIINPTIGSYDMTSLLLNRLKKTSNFDKKWFYCTYEELELNDEEKRLYPEAFHKLVSAEDIQIFENFPYEKVKMFASFFKDDPLVPSRISSLWADMYMNDNSSTQVYYEEGAKHDVTPAMINSFATWLIDEI